MRGIDEGLTHGAAVVRRRTGLAAVTGPDRVSWLQGMVTNDVARLGPGAGCYAAQLNPRGKVLALIVILADPDALWLMLDPDVPVSVARLDALLIMEDAEIADRSAESRVLTIVGARARTCLEDWLGASLDLDAPYRHRRFGDVRVVRQDLGYDVIAPAGEVDAVLGALADGGVFEADGSLWDRLSLEAGLPLYGVDVDETTTLPELGEKGIDYEKGCYTGQEVVAKVKYIGHVNRGFVGFRVSGPEAPSPGAAVRSPDREIGAVTRAVRSPAAGGVIALGFVRRGHEVPGTRVEISVGDAWVGAEVSSLPFVTRPWA